MLSVLLNILAAFFEYTCFVALLLRVIGGRVSHGISKGYFLFNDLTALLSS